MMLPQAPPLIQYRRDLWRLFETTPFYVLGGVVEVGVAEGNFSEDICRWQIQFPVIYLVDRWKHMKKAKGDSHNPQMWHDMNCARVRERTKPWANRVVILQEESTVAAATLKDDSLSLVYIDADHSYEGVISDIRAWFPKVKRGGYMAFHDYQNPAYGVKRAVTEMAAMIGARVLEMLEDKPEDAGAYFQC